MVWETKVLRPDRQSSNILYEPLPHQKIAVISGFLLEGLVELETAGLKYGDFLFNLVSF